MGDMQTTLLSPSWQGRGTGVLLLGGPREPWLGECEAYVPCQL